MDAARIEDRLDRIDVLGRSGGSRSELLAELRGLVQEAGADAGATEEGEEVVERLRTAPHGT